ncbi:hypothetical protein BH11BAC3_BH11BAC3_29630 [soil metagenome]
MKLRHFTELDGVRAVAALMVMFFHFFKGLETQNAVLITIQKYAIFGQTGVSLFFVLSGFLITRILYNTKQSTSYFSKFYIRRSLRIFPLYFLFLIIYYFLMPVLENMPLVPFGQQIWYWVYLQNVAMTFNWSNIGPNHFWSLAVEEHFYLFWPLVIYFFDKSKIKLVIILLIITAFITRVIMLKNSLGVFYFTFTRMDELVVGALLAMWEVENKLIPEKAKMFKLLLGITAIPTVILFVLFNGKEMVAVQSIKFILLSVFYFSLIGLLITLKENNWFKKIFQIKPLSYTGKISYGLYVYHPLCFYIVSTYLKIDSIILSFIVSFGFAYLIAALSYAFYESKFIALKKKFE